MTQQSFRSMDCLNGEMTTTTSIVNIDGVEPQIFCYSCGVVGDSIGAS